MRRAAERAVELSAGMGEGRAAAFAAIAHGMALVFAGEGAAGATSFRRAVDMIESGPALSQDPELAALAAMGPLYLREVDYGRALIDRGVEIVRDHAAVGLLPRLLHRVGRGEAASMGRRLAWTYASKLTGISTRMLIRRRSSSGGSMS